MSVPDVVERYLRVAAGGDNDAVEACFTEDAEVTDDGRTHHGRAAIRQWREDVAAAFEYTVEVTGTERDGDDYLVVTTVAGSFPGSPVQLKYRFELVGDLIRRLVIAP